MTACKLLCAGIPPLDFDESQAEVRDQPRHNNVRDHDARAKLDRVAVVPVEGVNVSAFGALGNGEAAVRVGQGVALVRRQAGEHQSHVLVEGNPYECVLDVRESVCKVPCRIA